MTSSARLSLLALVILASLLLLPSPHAEGAAPTKMYWTTQTPARILRADLTGSNVEDLNVLGVSAPTGLALDLPSSKMYWVNIVTPKIQRADLTGSNVEDLVTGLSGPMGLALDLPSSKM